jgi:DNA-binding GntR family transcriptional regulator
MTDSLAEQAYQAIRKDIFTCVLDPGKQIAQSQLVERFDFGITPIREALKRLEQEGFVRSIPRFGYVVSPITMKDVEDVYDLRLILEEAAVRKAIEHASDEELARIKECTSFTYVYQDRETYLHFLEHNISFHHAIALASGNRKLAAMLAEVLQEMTRIFHLGLELRDSAEEMRHEHVLLAEALCARDAGRAVEIVREQILTSRKRVLEDLTRRLGQAAIPSFPE